MEPDRPASDAPLAWAALLARWVEVAKASRRLPDDGDGGRWKRSVAAVIELEATILALGDLASLPPGHRAAARDLAEVAVQRAAARLHEAWGDEPMPAELLGLEDQAIVALRESLYAGLEELLWPGPGLLEIPELDLGPEPHRGTLAVMPPGSLAAPGEPVCFFADREPPAIPGCVRQRAPRPRQVYRGLDDSGRFIGDLVAPLEDDLPPGLPMLVPISLGGTPIAGFPGSREEWLGLQRAALDGRDSLPVRIEG
jgi:hypothetical protein